MGTVSVTLNEAQDDEYSDHIGIIKDLLVKVHDGYMFSASHDFGTIASSGGISSQYRGPNWEQQRKKVIERDNNTCQNCGAKGEKY